MDDIMLCPSCGKELPKESSFCPYCMTKFTPEIQMGNKRKKDNKPIKIIIAAVAVIIIVAAAVVAVLLVPDKEKTAATNSAAQSPSTSQADTTVAPSDDAATLPPADTQLYDTSVGFISGGFDDSASLFYDSCFNTAEHSSLIASESAYKGANIRFDCVVLSVDGGIALVEYGATRGFDGIYNSTADYAAVKINTVSAGDSLTVYGTFVGVEDYTLGGKSEHLPTFDVQSYTEFVYHGVPSPVFSAEDIFAAARRIFGENAIVRESVRSDFSDSAIADILVDGGLYYTAETDYGKYCIYAGENSFIIDCESTVQTEKYLLPAVGSDCVYTYTYDNVGRKFILSCLDKSFKVIWTREFKNTDDAVFDYTSDYFYIVADSNLYVLDVLTGENAANPKYVGARSCILKADDGLILVSDSDKDTVIKTDICGNTAWSVSLSGDVADSQVDVQALDSGYLICFESEQGSCYTVLVSDDGKVIFEYTAD